MTLMSSPIADIDPALRNRASASTARPIARPCPACGQDLAASPSRRVDWLQHPVRTCAGCGFGISERSDLSRTMLQQLQVPIDVARLVLVPVLILLIALVAASASMQLSNATVTQVPFSIAVLIPVGCGILGGLTVVLVAPHQRAEKAGAAWMIAATIATGIMILAGLIDQGRDLLIEVDLRRLAGAALLASLSGLFATYPIALVRNRLLRRRPPEQGARP